MSRRLGAGAYALATLLALAVPARAAEPPPAAPAATCTCADLEWLIRTNEANESGAALSQPDLQRYAALVGRCDPLQEIARRKKPPAIACTLANADAPTPFLSEPSSAGEPDAENEPDEPDEPRRVTRHPGRAAPVVTYPLPVEYFRIQVENDAFVSAHDSYYTNGLALETRFDAGPWMQAHNPWPASWRQRLINVQWAAGVAQVIYTPTQIDQTDVEQLRRDRPYSAWLHGDVGLNYHFTSSPFGTSLPGSTRLALLTQWGPVGKSAKGYEIQSNWHSLYRDLKGCSRSDTECAPKEPLGWRLSYTEGFFGFNARLLAESELGLSLPWKWGTSQLGSSAGVRLAYGVSADVGNVFLQGGGSLRLRAGLIGVSMASVGHTGPIEIGPTLTRPEGSRTFNEESPALDAESEGASAPPLPINPTLQRSEATSPDASAPVSFRDTPWPFELFFFAGVNGRAVAYNALIDGDTCTDGSITTCNDSRVASRTWVGDLELGLALRLRFLELAFADVWRTPELKWPSPGAVQHEFGVIRLTFLYR